MQRIIQLPEHVVAKIAAGEVVERPAYAVKELVENAIDAGASLIEIHVEESGLRRITAIDNGFGMSEEDLLLSFLPHTTSKLLQEELIGIKTLGFRGEALSSIASVSHMTIQSRTGDNPGGIILSVHHGNLQDRMPIGMPVGTIVTVDNLFANVPARKKFLKSPQTEFRHITEMMTQYALSYPEIHFVLTHNKKTIFDLPKKDESFDRVKTLLGQTIVEQLIPFSFEDGYVSMIGLLGKPQAASKQNQKQFTFVNNRSVTDRTIQLAVREAFGTLLPASNTPIFVLHISLPPEMVDVNVHPRKEQIAFLDPKTIFAYVKQAVTQTLADNNLTFHLAKFKQEHSARIGETTSFAGQLLREYVLSEKETIDLVQNPKFIQINKTYIMTVTKEGLLLLDQHAAHERIIFEKFEGAFLEQKKKKDVHVLPEPVSLSLALADAQIIADNLTTFRDMGFGIEHFQGSEFVIRSVPIVFKGRNSEKIIRDMISDLAAEGSLPSIDLRSRRMLAFLSCRAAVKAGDTLTNEQMKEIVSELNRTDNNPTCPHGRPTRIMFETRDIDTWFRR